MNIKEFQSRYIAANNNFQETTLSETALQEAPVQEVTSLNRDFWLVPSLLILATWGLFFISHFILRKSSTSRWYYNHRGSKTKTPCSSCRFFQNNPYLKCAVHPSNVLKQEANNCSDYWAQDRSHFSL